MIALRFRSAFQRRASAAAAQSCPFGFSRVRKRAAVRLEAVVRRVILLFVVLFPYFVEVRFKALSPFVFSRALENPTPRVRVWIVRVGHRSKEFLAGKRLEKVYQSLVFLRNLI